MTREIYTPIYISTSTTTTVYASGPVIIHVVNCPIALTGTATFRDAANATYFILPIGSIGPIILDDIFTNGLNVVTSAADKLILSVSQL